MKKLTAKVAKRIAKYSTASDVTTFQKAIDYIAAQAKLGHTNTFLDGELKDLVVIKKELEERGFRCYIDSTGPNKPKYLSVEWF